MVHLKRRLKEGGQFNEKKYLCCCHRFVSDPFCGTWLFAAAGIDAASKRTARQARHSRAYARFWNGSPDGRKDGRPRRDGDDAAIVKRRSQTSRCDDADAWRDDEDSRRGNEQG